MRKLLLLLACFIVSGGSFAQNTFSIVAKTARGSRPIVLQRTLTLPRSQVSFAQKILDAQKGKILNFQKQTLRTGSIEIPQYYIEAQISLARLNRPENIHGGYNYLRTMSKLAREPELIEPAHIRNWQEVTNSYTYNGAHHIVNKSSLKEIYKDMRQKAAEKGLPFPINLTEMQNNAPAVFHRLHGHPDYTYIFHNSGRQVGLYYTGGIKMVIEDFFMQLETLATQTQHPELLVPAEVQKATFIEAELWCKMFHLRWE